MARPRRRGFLQALEQRLNLSTGLVAAYAFNEGTGKTVADASGNGNSGTVANTTWSTAGKFGDALSFNGTNSVLTIPNSASLNPTSALTLEAWVNPTTVSSAWRDVVYKGNDEYFLEATSTNASAPAAGATVGSADVAAYGTKPLSANTWSFLTETYDGTTIRLYVNGAQVASQAQSGSLKTSTNPLQIGGDSLFGQYFKGLIDNVRIYNVALTAAEIQDDMNTPVAAGTPPPTAPANLTATAGGNTITLNWATSQDTIGVSSYVVQRENPGSTSFVQIGTATGTTYSDTGLASNSTFNYEVQAVDWAGNQSAVSNVASATTSPPDTTPPSTPTNLAAVAAGAGQINLSWTPSTDNVGVTGYYVWRENPGSMSFAQIGTTTAPTYSDTGLAPHSTYSYEVRATDAAGNLSGFSSTASATTPAANPGLVAAYDFDQGSGSVLTDVSGNGHAGTIVNATWSTAGKYGDALSFNGTSALVDIPDATSLHLTTGMTLEAWVQPTAAANGWQDVIYKGNDDYYLESSSNPGNAPVAGGTVGPSDTGASGTSMLPTNAWSFLTETYDGTTIVLYVNGVQVATLALSGSLATSTDPLQIAGDSLYGQYFQGLIDNIRIYDVALTPAEIQDDMNTPVAAGTPPPTAPANLMATAGGGTITLNWATSQNAIGVGSYLVQREDPGSTSFVQIGTATGTTYTDTGLTFNSTYRYEVQAVDWAGNQSAVSNVASATAQLGISPTTTFLQPGQTQPFTANATGVIWSVNGVAGGSASTGTITSTGSYTAPNGVGSYTVTGTTADGMHSASASVQVTNYSGTLTDRNDNMRTGANLDETVLTPADVNFSTFGKLFSYPLDGIAFASPLYVPHVAIPGMGYHNVVIVATEHDSVYAFDADGLSTTPLWHVSFINPTAGITPIPAADTLELVDIPNEVGITGTPVIDPTTGTLYLVADTKVVAGGTTTYFQTLHALDITTGAEKLGGPVVIQATVPGTGSDSVNGMVTFNPLYQNQHSGLLLSNGVVYVAFSSHGDDYPNWHGWLFGYDAGTLKQVMVYNDTADGNGGGVWVGADGLATDSTGDIYVTTGNGDFNANTGGVDYGDSALKITPGGTVADYFTPFDQASLNTNDLDLASGGVLLLPTQSGPYPDEMIFAGKGGTVYVVNRDNMGHYNPSNNSQIIQTLPNIFPAGNVMGNYSSPVYYDGNVYFAPVGGTIQAFSLTNGLLSTAPTSVSAESFAYPGGMMAISANGATNGILWAVEDTGKTTPGVLHAYLATNLSDELYNSGQSGSRDTMDLAAKFSMPTVANGKVYVGGCTELSVYGLLAPASPSAGATIAASQVIVSSGATTTNGATATSIRRAPVASLPPVASPDTFVLSQNGPNSGTGAMSVLANDTSADGQPQNLVATLVSNTTHGRLTFNPDGSFTYTPNSTFQGIDRFTYQVSEGGEIGNTVTDTLLSYDASLVDKLYRQVLHRPADDAGLAAWTSMLDQGEPLDAVAAGIFNSPERLDALVSQFYEQYLGRAPDPGGLAFWVADWRQKGDPRDVVLNILASREFYDDAADTNAGFVTRLYEKLLNREPDASGFDFWLKLMGPPTNQSRAQVATQFYDTPEEHGLLVDFLFSEYFDNVNPLPDPTPYVNQLNAGATQTQVEKAIIDSPDYRGEPSRPAVGTVGKEL